MMKHKKIFGLKGSFVFALLFLFALSMFPASVKAQILVHDAARLALIQKRIAQKEMDWLKSFSLLTKTIKGITDVLEVVDEFMDELEQAMRTTGLVRNLEQQMRIRTKVYIADAKDKEAVQNVLLRRAMETRMQYVKPPTQHLCKTIKGYQLALTTEEFEESVACLASSAIEDMYRGAKDDGSGPQYAAEHRKNRCALKLGNPIDGYPSECVDSSTTGTDGRKLTDADLSATILDGGQVLEVSDTKSSTIDGVAYETMDPGSTEQKFWAAGLFYCMGLAGPRPTPPVKEKLLTPEGIVKRAQWNHCAALQSAAVKGCTSLLAYHSRPNSKTNAQLRVAQFKMCKEIENAGVTIPEELDGCRKGISPYHAMKLSHALCKHAQFYVSAAAAGTPQDKLMAMVDKCTAAWNAAQTLEAERYAALAEATAALAKLPECWRGTGR